MQAESYSIGKSVGLALSVSRMHIVAIAAMGLITFGWVFTGKYHFFLAAVCALDWFLVNLLNRVVDQKEDQVNSIAGTDFVARHRRWITLCGMALLLASLALIHLITPAITPLRIAYHLLGLAYNWPLLPGRRRIKQLYFFKNTASTTGFMLTVFGYPLAATLAAGATLAPDISALSVVLGGLFFFLFELSYEVIYDLRDAPGDASAGVRSYPVAHGIPVATRIVDCLIIASMGVLIGGYAAGAVPWRLLIMIFAPAIQLVVYKRAMRRGIIAKDCIGITWIGVALLVTYHVWVVLDLPGARL